MQIKIETRQDLLSAINESGLLHYVYVLCEPMDESEKPFYVGIGQGERIFYHEDEALDSSISNSKLEVIRSIWARQLEVKRYIDSFHPTDPWDREEELINKWGLRKDGTGILTNEQRYSPTTVKTKMDVELRKYAEYGNVLPKNFKHRNTKLIVGENRPKSNKSVYGKIYSILLDNPGITGEELAILLLEVDFSKIKSAYTKNGTVSLPWLAGYIDGGFYKKNLFIQELK